MLEKHTFYNGTIDVDLLYNKYFSEERSLKSVKNELITALRGMSNLDDKFTVLIYQAADSTISLFIRVKDSQLADIDRIVFELIEGQIVGLTAVSRKFSSTHNFIELVILNTIDPLTCYYQAKEALNTLEGLFSNQDFMEFFKDYSESESLDEKTIDDKDMTEIFSGVFDEIIEEASSVNQIELLGLNSLVGLDNFKSEIYKIANYSKISSTFCKSSKERLFPIHYVFTINPGMGITTILETFAKKLLWFGIVDNDKVLEFKGSMLFDSKSKHIEDTSLFRMNNRGEYSFDKEYSVIAIDVLTYIDEPQFDMNKLINVLKYARGKTIFVFVMDKQNEKRNLSVIETFKQKINIRQIDFADYTEVELVAIGGLLLKKYGFELDHEAENYLIERIKEERLKGTFYNIRSIQRMIEEVRIRKIFDIDGENSSRINKLSMEDLKSVINEKEICSVDAWKELDELVGLDEVKERVKEIVSFAKVQKRLNEVGIKTKKSSYHMMFTGNPGTGKTTIARILGKLFKEIGVLSIGDTIEVTRDGLVSIYVGNTAPLVRDKVRQAMGSVLFIDEAYSLYEEEGRHNYGKEAIDTLVKLMEDNREDFIVIMAGYKDKMQKLLSVNQGLKERIAYKIEFPDYDSDDLVRIFSQVLGNDYIIEAEAKEKIRELFITACKNKGESFANGRLARNVAERLKVKQSLRICNDNLFDRENMLTIKLQDIEELYKDADIKGSLLNTESNNRKIGFLQDNK